MKITVITVSFNEEKNIARTIESVLSVLLPSQIIYSKSQEV